MAVAKVVHVAPDKDDGWKVVQDGHLQSVHRTQKAAIAAGRALASKNSAELVAHERNGEVRLKDSSPLIQRKILEAPGVPSVSRAKIAAAARFTLRRDGRFSMSKPRVKKSSVSKGTLASASRKQRVG
jgi:hypothetical protein